MQAQAQAQAEQTATVACMCAGYSYSMALQGSSQRHVCVCVCAVGVRGHGALVRGREGHVLGRGAMPSMVVCFLRALPRGACMREICDGSVPEPVPASPSWRA